MKGSPLLRTTLRVAARVEGAVRGREIAGSCCVARPGVARGGRRATFLVTSLGVIVFTVAPSCCIRGRRRVIEEILDVEDPALGDGLRHYAA